MFKAGVKTAFTWHNFLQHKHLQIQLKYWLKLGCWSGIESMGLKHFPETTQESMNVQDFQVHHWMTIPYKSRVILWTLQSATQTYFVLSVSLLYFLSSLPSLSPWDQCPYANRGFLFRSTVEPTFQNKSALKHHTYFMDLKCSKSKPFWIAELRGVYNKAKSKKRMCRSMTSFGIDEALLHLR